MAASAAAFIIEGNIYCFVNGFSQATTTFVGQNYGARNLRRCFRITKVAFGVEAAFLLVVTVPVLFFSPELIRLFNGDPTSSSWGRSASFTSPGRSTSMASSTSSPDPCAAMAIPCRRLSSSWSASAASVSPGCTPYLPLTATSWSSWRPTRPAGWSRPSS